jgi:hypothetical protein
VEVSFTIQIASPSETPQRINHYGDDGTAKLVPSSGFLVANA